MAPESERKGEGTKFTIDRKIFSSDIWFASPWKLKIFIYLIGNANHTPIKFKGIQIDRGQLIRSYRTIAKDCAYMVGYRLKKPSLDTIRRICEELAKEQRIVQRTVHCGTLFTICNYNTLQAFPKPRTERRTRESSYTHRTPTVQNKNKERINNENIYTNDFLKFWNAYPKKVGKKVAFNSWKKIQKPETDFLIQTVRRHSQSEQWQKNNGQFIPHPTTWLNERRWEDELECSPGPATPESDLEKWLKQCDNNK